MQAKIFESTLEDPREKKYVPNIYTKRSGVYNVNLQRLPSFISDTIELG